MLCRSLCGKNALKRARVSRITGKHVNIMDNICNPAPHLKNLEPYDPKYLPAEVMLSANENTSDVPPEIRRQIEHAIHKVQLNRYPDPLANDLRDMIAEANGLDRDQVIVGNGGDELLFNLALAWGGPGRKFLNLPPTFSVYENNAVLTGTEVVDVPRLADFSVDVPSVVARLLKGDIAFTIITSPNNPTGNIVPADNISYILESTDALVMVDEAYFEFSRDTVRPFLERFPNLVILRTFSKAFSLAGVRLGYLLGQSEVIDQFKKVRQPYSVDAVSQAIARVVYENRALFEPTINDIMKERSRLMTELKALDDVTVYPSKSNYILFRLSEDHDAGKVWQDLFENDVLIRDFSQTPRLQNCLRVSVGNVDENTRFMNELKKALTQ